ncbi:S1 RNA-binding domain-containing protein [Candidatus Berkelbacteria bacterium]|nr:S1 RNA-binding domain-containing protein [Candidatus Berkelbacteria bacterium]
MAQATPSTMEQVVEALGDELIPFRRGITVGGTVQSVSKGRIIVDLRGIALGLIPAREFSSQARELKVGDELSAYILLQENDDGYVILSLRRADKERHLKALEGIYAEKSMVSVHVKDTNRGGLIVEYGNIEGFLPVSQLATHHQPRGGRDRLRDGLKDLVSQDLQVKLITFDPKENKIIFSEKAAGDALAEERAGELKIGEEIEGAVTGVVDFGIFVNIGNLEGLVHISEISWDRVENLERLYSLGDKVRVQVIAIEGGRVSLSVKRLTPDPWQQAIKQFSPGQTVTGTMVRLSPFGAFIEIAKDVVGLMHISEFDINTQEELEEKVKVGDTDQFQILSIDTASRKVGLAYPDDRRPSTAKKLAEAHAQERATEKA